MSKITTLLTHEDKAEEAVKLYTSVFENSRVVRESRAPRFAFVAYPLAVGADRSELG